MVRLFSFWTWKDFFLRWLGSAASHPASRETAEHLLSQDGQQESELARFLSSLPQDGRQCHGLDFHGDSQVVISFGGFDFTLTHGTGVEASYCEFIEAVASSEIVFCNEVRMDLVGDNSCKHVEAFADALHKSSNRFRKLYLTCGNGSPVSFAKCVWSMLLKNDAIQDLSFNLVGQEKKMGKKLVVEFTANIDVPHNLQILKSFAMNVSKLDGKGMEELMKLFQGPHSVLEDLIFFSITSNAQLKHISSMLASSTFLKRLYISNQSTMVKKPFTRRYNNIGLALGSNQSLETIECDISSSIELKVLLEPLMPKTNNIQCNTTLTKLQLCKSIGGKKGIETLVDMLYTNTTLLELGLPYVEELSLPDTQGVEIALAILEARKINKSLKIIDFFGCKAIGGYKVLGTMMDLLLKNHIIQDIFLYGTSLNESGDANYVSSTL